MIGVVCTRTAVAWESGLGFAYAGQVQWMSVSSTDTSSVLHLVCRRSTDPEQCKSEQGISKNVPKEEVGRTRKPVSSIIKHLHLTPSDICPYLRVYLRARRPPDRQAQGAWGQGRHGRSTWSCRRSCWFFWLYSTAH